MGGQRKAPAALPPRKPRYPSLGGSQGGSGPVREISSPPAFDRRTVQLVASRYTDSAIQTPCSLAHDHNCTMRHACNIRQRETLALLYLSSSSFSRTAIHSAFLSIRNRWLYKPYTKSNNTTPSTIPSCNCP